MEKLEKTVFTYFFYYMLLILCCCWPALERLFFILRLRSKLIPQPFQPVAFLLRLPREVPISASCNGGWLPWQTFIRNQWGAERETYLFIVVKPSLKKKKDLIFCTHFGFALNIKWAIDSHVLIPPHAAGRNKTKLTETSGGVPLGRACSLVWSWRPSSCIGLIGWHS